MNYIYLKFFLILSIILSILLSYAAHLGLAQSENKTSSDDKNNTKRIFNLVNNTITVVDKTTNEIISTMPLNPNPENTTTNNSKNSLTFPSDKANTTNLTEKFNALSK